MKDTYKQKGMVDQISTVKATHLHSKCVHVDKLKHHTLHR